jgi:hypothetical protein
MTELERMLTRLGDELDWPQTPPLAPRVTARLRSRPRRFPLRRVLVFALIAVLLLAGTVVAAVPSVRDAVGDFFGLTGATVERTTTLPAPPPDRALDLGRRTTLQAAGAQVGFEPLVPSDPGEPDAVYLKRPVVSLTYRARPGLPRAGTTSLGLLVSEFRGDLHPDFLGKLAGPGTRIERLQGDGQPALWIEGAQHFFFYRDPRGRIVEEELRLAQNVLLLERGDLLVRLEGAMQRERALAIAGSLR